RKGVALPAAVRVQLAVSRARTPPTVAPSRPDSLTASGDSHPGERTMNVSTFQCLAPSRFWKVALRRDTWAAAEADHLARCERCRRLPDEGEAAVREKGGAARRAAAALVLLAALVKYRACSRFALPRPTTGFDTAPARDDGFVTYAFDDPDLHAAV